MRMSQVFLDAETRSRGGRRGERPNDSGFLRSLNPLYARTEREHIPERIEERFGFEHSSRACGAMHGTRNGLGEQVSGEPAEIAEWSGRLHAGSVTLCLRVKDALVGLRHSLTNLWDAACSRARLRSAPWLERA